MSCSEVSKQRTDSSFDQNLGLGVYEEKKPGQSDSEDDEDSDEEKLIIPNSTPVDKSKKPSIQMLDEQGFLGGLQACSQMF